MSPDRYGEHRSDEPLPSDDFDDLARLGNLADALLEQQDDRVARGEHFDGDRIHDRRIEGDDEARVGDAREVSVRFHHLRDGRGALDVELERIDELDGVPAVAGAHIGEAAGEAQ